MISVPRQSTLLGLDVHKLTISAAVLGPEAAGRRQDLLGRRASPGRVWGNSLRNALLRFRPAHISLAASPLASPRRTAEPLPDPHPDAAPSHSSRRPVVTVVRPRSAAGAPR
jgi:hypothetical protein